MRRVSEARATHAYAGYCPGCGALTAAHVDYPDDPQAAREVAAFVAKLIRSGRRVERVTIEEVRRTLAFCACKSKPKITAQLSLGVA